MDRKAENMYYVVLYRKNLQSPPLFVASSGGCLLERSPCVHLKTHIHFKNLIKADME